MCSSADAGAAVRAGSRRRDREPMWGVCGGGEGRGSRRVPRLIDRGACQAVRPGNGSNAETWSWWRAGPAGRVTTRTCPWLSIIFCHDGVWNSGSGRPVIDGNGARLWPCLVYVILENSNILIANYSVK